MAYRARGSYLWSWKQTLLICLTILVGQMLSTWYLASRLPDMAEISALTVRDNRRARESRRELELAPGGELPPSEGVPLDLSGDAPPVEPTPGATDAPADPALEGTWSNAASQAVERLDTAMARRLEGLALEQGLDPTEILPDPELREKAIASGDLRSDEAQALIAEYTRILDELGSTQGGGAEPPPQP
jgi:hypothetical protein